MKRFILKLIQLILPIIIILILINSLYIRTEYWKTENNMNKFSDIPYNIKLVNLGSSHELFGIQYEFVPEINSWNFALTAQPFFYDYSILKNYVSHLSEEAVVLIPVSYFEITQRLDYSDYRKRYYRILPRSLMDTWSLREYLIYSKIPVFSAGKNLIKIFKADDTSADDIDFFYPDDDFLLKYSIKKHNSWTSPKIEFGQEGYEKNISEVSSIIDFCYSNNLVPVLISLPVTDILNEQFENDNDFFEKFEQFSTDLCNKYPDLIYLDYSRNKAFTTNHTFFCDGDHMNKLGAEKYTKALVEDLKKMGCLK